MKNPNWRIEFCRRCGSHHDFRHDCPVLELTAAELLAEHGIPLPSKDAC